MSGIQPATSTATDFTRSTNTIKCMMQGVHFLKKNLRLLSFPKNALLQGYQKVHAQCSGKSTIGYPIFMVRQANLAVHASV
jgi:hypothetical protein